MGSPESRVYQLLGLQGIGTEPTEQERERDVIDDMVTPRRPAFTKQVALGAAQGLLEPLGFLPPVGDFIETHLDPNGPQMDPRGSTLGRALGFMAGFALPTGAALKAGSMIARGGAAVLRGGRLAEAGITSVRGLNFIKSADAFADLGALGNMTRGSIAGALLGAGSTADDPGERVANILKDAAFFGVGDAIAYPVFRAIGKLKLTDRMAKKLSDAVHRSLVGGGAHSEADAKLLGAALKVADMIIPDEDIVTAAGGVANRRVAVQLGLESSGLQKLHRGETLVIQGLDTIADDLTKVFRKMPDMEYRKVSWSSKATKESGVDILVARKGDLDSRLVAEYKRNADRHGKGFVKGQRVRYEGADYVITSTGKRPGEVKAYIPGRQGGPLETLNVTDVTVMPLAVWRAGPRGVKNARGLWNKFAEEYGQFPTDGFNEAFEEFTTGLVEAGKLTRGQYEDLKEYFATRVLESLAEVDKPLGQTLSRIRTSMSGRTHPDGPLATLAAQHGYVTFPRRSRGRPMTAVRDVMTGQEEVFATADAAKAWIQANARDLADFIPKEVVSPLPFNFFGFRGVGMPQIHTAVDIRNWHGMSKWLMLAEPVLPRLRWLQMAQEAVDNLLGEAAPQFYGPFTRLQRNIMRSRLSMKPHAEKLRKIVKDYDQETLRNITAVLDEPQKYRRVGLANRLGLTDEQFESMEQIEEFMIDQLQVYFEHVAAEVKGKPKGARALAKEFLREYYFPHIRQKPPAGSGKGDWIASVTAALAERGKKPNEILLQLGREMESAGIGPGRLESNPWNMANRFMRTAHTKIHVDSNFKEIRAIIEELPDTGDLQLVKKSLQDYLVMSYGGSAEAYAVIRMAAEGTFKNLGIPLAEKEMDRMVNSLVGLNYAAFMAFRPALALRNLTQTLTSTLPLIQSPTALAYGIKASMTKAGRDRALRAGAIPTHSVAQPMEDVIYRQFLAEQFKARGRKAPDVIRKMLERADKFGQIGLGTETIKVGGRDFRVGFYSTADEWNRSIAFHAQRYKTIKAMRKWRAKKNPDTAEAIAAFNKEAGLTFLGEASAREFHNIARTEGRLRAIDWVGQQLANETQWVYQLGAGPAMFSHGVGRLFGMYGTWPSWYAAFLARGASRWKNDPVGAARFWGWTAATWAAIPAAGVAIGLDFSRWSPLSSFTWAGGPAVDWFKDTTEIISGVTPSGPTAGRALALSGYGIRDRGNKIGFPYLGYLDPRPDSGFDIEDPTALVMSILEMVTPGMLAVKDVMGAAEEPTLGRAALRSIGFRPTPGHAWPRIEGR